MKNVIKYKHENESGVLQYVVYAGDLLALSEKDSLKVSYIEKHNSLEATFDPKSSDFKEIKASVIKNQDFVKKVYDFMIETKTAYFTDGFESLCVIKLEE